MCHVLSVVIQNALMLNVVMLGVVMLSVVVPSSFLDLSGRKEKKLAKNKHSSLFNPTGGDTEKVLSH